MFFMVNINTFGRQIFMLSGKGKKEFQKYVRNNNFEKKNTGFFSYHFSNGLLI